jgi:hypothetical protein
MATMEERKDEIPPSPPTNGKDTPSDVGSVEGLDVLLLATDEHPAHPRNWPVLKRWGVLATLCTFQAFMYVLGAIRLMIV